MSLGVLNNLSAVYAENNLNNTNSSLNTVLQQLSSGSKINSGADDAAGLSLVDGLQANQMALTESQTNAQEGVGLLQVADGALSQVTNLLNRAVTLATEASNGTLNSSQDTAANQEYQSILSEINNIGTTTTYNQEQVFGSNTNIYTGDSSAQGASINDLNIRTLSSSNVGDSGGAIAYSSGQTAGNVFIDLSNDGTQAHLSDSLGASSDTTALQVTYLSTGANGAPTTQSATITVGGSTQYSNSVSGMIDAINGAGLGLTATLATAQQAGTGAVATAGSSDLGGGGANDTGIMITGAGIGVGGAGTNGVGVVGTLAVGVDTDTLGGTLTVVGSDGKSHAITLGTTGTTDNLADLMATINAAGYGVNVTANDAGTQLTFNSANSAVSVSGSSLTDAGTATPTMLANTPTPGAQFASEVGQIAITAGGAYGDTLGGSLSIGAQTININSSDDTLATLAQTINSGDYGVTASYSQTNANIILTSSNSALAIGTGVTDTNNAGDIATTNPGTASSAFYSIGIGSTGGVKDWNTDVNTGTVDVPTLTYGGSANTGFTSDLTGTNGIATINYTDQAGQSLSSTDLSNQSNSQTALNDLNQAISDVAAQDGYVGAQINTLNAVSQVLSTQQENVQAAQNSVQATDYASATSSMSKYEILSQTGISALAQANSIQQEVTKLLQ